jgi:hypothetical protein
LRKEYSDVYFVLALLTPHKKMEVVKYKDTMYGLATVQYSVRSADKTIPGTLQVQTVAKRGKPNAVILETVAVLNDEGEVGDEAFLASKQRLHALGTAWTTLEEAMRLEGVQTVHVTASLADKFYRKAGFLYNESLAEFYKQI